MFEVKVSLYGGDLMRKLHQENKEVNDRSMVERYTTVKKGWRCKTQWFVEGYVELQDGADVYGNKMAMEERKWGMTVLHG